MRIFRRTSRERGAKVFYATDVHGSERTWRKFLNAASFYGADVLVMGGDVMGKLVIPIIRRQIRKAMYAHGLGRHTRDEIVAFGTRSIEAIADYLGDKPYFMGAEPTGVDATVFAFVAGTLCPTFDTPLRVAAEHRDNLRRYVGRMTARYYPEMQELAGCPAAA